MLRVWIQSGVCKPHGEKMPKISERKRKVSKYRNLCLLLIGPSQGRSNNAALMWLAKRRVMAKEFLASEWNTIHVAILWCHVTHVSSYSTSILTAFLWHHSSPAVGGVLLVTGQTVRLARLGLVVADSTQHTHVTRGVVKSPGRTHHWEKMEKNVLKSWRCSTVNLSFTKPECKSIQIHPKDTTKGISDLYTSYINF